MGWFFNRNNSDSEANDQNNNKNSSNHRFFHRSSSSTMSKTCEHDPEDNNFMICKTVIKDQRGTRQNEERVPVNKSFDNSFEFKNITSNPLLRNMFDEDDQKVFDKFQSFLIQPSFFDMHHSSNIPNNQNESQSFFRSYSKSETCKPDPQDNQYLICKSKISDENGTRQIQKRVKNSMQFSIPFFAGGFENAGHEIDHEMHNLMKQINQGFNMFLPFVGSFMNFAHDMENLDKAFNSQYNQPHEKFFSSNSDYHGSYAPGKNENEYFGTSQPKKDTNIYDL